MIYADTDFFLALMKSSDWLKDSALKLYEQYKGQLQTSDVTLIELLLVARKYHLDPERLLINVLEIANVPESQSTTYLQAARLIREHDIGVFDAIHAAFCGPEGTILSSDKVFEKLGLNTIKLGNP